MNGHDGPDCLWFAGIRPAADRSPSLRKDGELFGNPPAARKLSRRFMCVTRDRHAACDVHPAAPGDVQIRDREASNDRQQRQPQSSGHARGPASEQELVGRTSASASGRALVPTTLSRASEAYAIGHGAAGSLPRPTHRHRPPGPADARAATGGTRRRQRGLRNGHGRLRPSRPHASTARCKILVPSAQPSLRGSEPAISTPRCRSMRIACAPPHGDGATATSWPRIPKAFERSLRHATLDHGLFSDEEEARRVDRRLHIHAIVDQVGDDLRMAHRLVVRAHDAERQFAMAVAERQRRDDGVHRPLARARTCWDGRDRRTKQAPRLVSMIPVSSRADADAERGIERIDQGHRHAVAIDHREVDGIAAGRGRGRQRHAACAVDAAGELAGECACRSARGTDARMRPGSAMWVSRTA